MRTELQHRTVSYRTTVIRVRDSLLSTRVICEGYKLSHPPLLISASNFRLIVAGILWDSQTSRSSLSYRFWLRINCLFRRRPGSTSPCRSRYGAKCQEPYWLCKYKTIHFLILINSPTFLPHLPLQSSQYLCNSVYRIRIRIIHLLFNMLVTPTQLLIHAAYSLGAENITTKETNTGVGEFFL